MVRTILITKGEKLYASLIGFIEILIWLKVVSAVLTGISENPARMFTYALGFSLGCLIGIMVEEKLALGLTSLQIIGKKEDQDELINLLRTEDKAVVITEGVGLTGEPKSIITTHISSKDRKNILEKLGNLDKQLVITVSETKKVYGGYGIKK